MYCIISDGSKTIYASTRRNSDGSVIEKGGNPYNANILNKPTLSKSKNNSQIKITDTRIELEMFDQDNEPVMADMNISKADTLTVEAWLNADDHEYLSSDLKILDAQMIALAPTSNRVILRVKDEDSVVKATTAAPDLKQIAGSDTFNDGRTYPIIYGTVYHAMPLEMIKGSTFWVQGKVLAAYDNGREVNFNQAAGSYPFTVPNAPIGELTVDVEYFTEASVTIGSSTTELLRNRENVTFNQSTDPVLTHVLVEGDIWEDTNDASGRLPKRWSGSAWVAIRDGRTNSGLNDSGQIKQIVKGTNLPTTGMSTGLNVTQNYLGYHDGSGWAAFIRDTGAFYFGDGGTTFGTDAYISFYDSDASGSPDTFEISTAEFSVDNQGNATFGGTLSAATGRFLGDVSFLNDSSTYYSKTIVTKNYPKGASSVAGLSVYAIQTGFYQYNSTASSSIDNRFSKATDNLIKLSTTGKEKVVNDESFVLLFSMEKTGTSPVIDQYVDIDLGGSSQTLAMTTTGKYTSTIGCVFYIEYTAANEIFLYVSKLWYIDSNAATTGANSMLVYLYDNNNNIGYTYNFDKFGVSFMLVND